MENSSITTWIARVHDSQNEIRKQLSRTVRTKKASGLPAAVTRDELFWFLNVFTNIFEFGRIRSNV